MTRSKFFSHLTSYLFLVPYLTLFIGFLIIPLCYGLGLSLFRWEMLSALPPKFIGIQNYLEALHSEYFWKAFSATFTFVIFTVPINIAIALTIACGVNAVTGKRQAFYRAAFFFPTLVSISVAGILWRWFYNGEFGLFNAYLSHFGVKIPWLTNEHWAMTSMVLMTLWWTLGGPMVILLAGLSQIPRQYYEAAEIDGAGRWTRFLHITLPQLRPVLLFVFVMNIIGSFQVFGQAFMVTQGGPENSTRVLVQYIYETAFMNYRMGYAAAMSWLLFLVIAVFSFAQFRLMREK